MSLAENAAAGTDSGFLRDVLQGLSASPKSIPAKYFYDEQGSRLFEAICRTPEYYPTRVETELLARIAPEIGAKITPGAVLVEFGSGASDKTRLLLNAAPQLSAYTPMDISAEALEAAAERIARAYPKLEVIPLPGDFTRPLSLPHALDGRPRMGFFPGSTIGNFDRTQATAFLRSAHSLLGDGAYFLVGVDLVKDAAVLRAAYNDAEGVTAAFNLNLLARINRELDGDFDLTAFRHEAVWNAHLSRIEMHLVSAVDQVVHVAGRAFRFEAGETIHTENSYKYQPERFTELAGVAGWNVETFWRSDEPRFGIFLLAG